MVLESTMICLDNSEWMRNGDYAPTRLMAQQDAVSLVITSRTDSNSENTVGILTMGGKGVEMLASPTENVGKLMATFAQIVCKGNCDFSSSVQIAQLALKHRKNKNGGQRIIIFVGSPIDEKVDDLQKIGKMLKKNNVAVDVVIMGEHQENQDKLTEFVNAVNSNDNSHLISVPAGVLPSDALVSSPVFAEYGGHVSGTGGRGTVGGAADDQFAEYGGIDPSLDPELAMAIRVSTEEARMAEQARLAAAGIQPQGAQDEHKASEHAPDSLEEDEEALLRAALAISMGENVNTATEQKTQNNDDDEDEDERALRLALELSLKASEPESADSDAVNQSVAEADALSNASGNLLDQEFVSQLLGSVDVDLNDPLIQAALQQLQESSATPSNNKRSGESKDDADQSENKKSKEEK